MKLRAVTTWRTRGGKRRMIRLYRAYRNMHGRTKGTCTRFGSDYWIGLEIGFKNWKDFREWSLANGYSKKNNSLDRQDSTGHYVKHNLKWVPVSVNSWRANYFRWQAERDFSTAEV